MNKRQLLTLTSVNLRYANPQVTDKARKKGKSGTQLTRYLIQQYVLSGFVFLVIYGLTMIALDFSRLPGFFHLLCCSFWRSRIFSRNLVHF